nr:PilZ domain-containing protein [Craterilacuibacter sp. RT1T]
MDTVSFDAELPLALAPHSHYNAKLARETRLALRILAAPTEQRSDADPQLQRLEAKLDLALEVALLSRHPDSAPLHPCRLGLNSLAWHSEQDQSPGANLLLQLSPHADSALTLFLPATVLACQSEGPQGYTITASIEDALSDNTRPLWEKWIFRRHREQISRR